MDARDWTILLIAIVPLILIIIPFYVLLPDMQNNINYLCCCNGSACSDTLYDGEKCVLIMCRNMPFIEKSQCYYPADEKCKNLTAI